MGNKYSTYRITNCVCQTYSYRRLETVLERTHDEKEQVEAEGTNHPLDAHYENIASHIILLQSLQDKLFLTVVRDMLGFEGKLMRLIRK